MSYCSGCFQVHYCTEPCQTYLEYLSVIGECLNGHPFGHDPCMGCHGKADFDCPLHGPESKAFQDYINYRQLKLDLTD